MLILHVVVICILLIIFYEDLKYREVSIFLFPVLFISLSLIVFRQSTWQIIAANFFNNVIYLILILGICFVYVYLRFRSLNLAAGLGWGDVLLLLTTAIWFELTEFVLFTTTCFIVSLIIHLVFVRFSDLYRKHDSVPLAGFMSLCMVPWFLFDLYVHH